MHLHHIHQTAQPSSTSASASASVPPSVLAQQIDAVKTEFADVFAEPSGLPPDRGIEQVVPIEPDAQSLFKRMYQLKLSRGDSFNLIYYSLLQHITASAGAALLHLLQSISLSGTF